MSSNNSLSPFSPQNNQYGQFYNQQSQLNDQYSHNNHNGNQPQNNNQYGQFYNQQPQLNNQLVNSPDVQGLKVKNLERPIDHKFDPIFSQFSQNMKTEASEKAARYMAPYEYNENDDWDTQYKKFQGVEKEIESLEKDLKDNPDDSMQIELFKSVNPTRIKLIELRINRDRIKDHLDRIELQELSRPKAPEQGKKNGPAKISSSGSDNSRAGHADLKEAQAKHNGTRCEYNENDDFNTQFNKLEEVLNQINYLVKFLKDPTNLEILPPNDMMRTIDLSQSLRITELRLIALHSNLKKITAHVFR